jgi:Fe2+ or Zn2+ uptake regulation protein
MSRCGYAAFEILTNPHLTATTVRVYVALGLLRDHRTGLCNPSYAALRQFPSISETSLRRALRSLQQDGVIIRRSRAGGANWFELPRFGQRQTAAPSSQRWIRIRRRLVEYWVATLSLAERN